MTEPTEPTKAYGQNLDTVVCPQPDCGARVVWMEADDDGKLSSAHCTLGHVTAPVDVILDPGAPLPALRRLA